MVSFWFIESQCLEAIRGWGQRKTSDSLRSPCTRAHMCLHHAQKPHTDTKTMEWKIKTIHLFARVLVAWIQSICENESSTSQLSKSREAFAQSPCVTWNLQHFSSCGPPRLLSSNAVWKSGFHLLYPSPVVFEGTI